MTNPPPPPPSEPPPPGEEWPTQVGPPYADETVVREGAYAPEPGYVPPPEEPGSRIGKGLLLGLLAVALVAGGILAYYFATKKDKKSTTTVTAVSSTAPAAAGTVAVPKVVGLKENDALVKLGAAGLRPKEKFQPTSKASGVVVSQAPGEASTAKRGSQITIVIDSGAPSVAIPDVKGLSVAAATAKLDAVGLDSTQTTVTSNAGKPGTVVDLAPAPGSKVKKGTSVTLSIAKAAPVAVPDVVGQPQADAQSALQKAGFTVNAVTVPGPTPKDQVVAQNPAAGTKADSGSSVRINVSDGTGSGGGGGGTTSTATTTTRSTTTTAAPTTSTVPDVAGQTEAAAAQAFNKVGLLISIVFVPSQDPLGQVVQQAKPGGTTVPRNSTVQINLSHGPGTTDSTVPDVTGKTLTEALAALNGVKLRLIYVKTPVTSQAQAGKVVKQTPSAGAKAPQNAQVLVYLGAYQK